MKDHIYITLSSAVLADGSTWRNTVAVTGVDGHLDVFAINNHPKSGHIFTFSQNETTP